MDTIELLNINPGGGFDIYGCKIINVLLYEWSLLAKYDCKLFIAYWQGGRDRKDSHWPQEYRDLFLAS